MSKTKEIMLYRLVQALERIADTQEETLQVSMEMRDLMIGQTHELHTFQADLKQL